VPFKLAHKSAVWYRPSVLRLVGLGPPKRWNDWLALNRALTQAGVRPLALAAGDGWVLTDFLENVLLATSPSTYRALAVADRPRLSRQPAVGAALRLLGAMWSTPGTLAVGSSGRWSSSSRTRSWRCSAISGPRWCWPPTSPNR
jgi:alpha-glucoside transport system substrate-binding protein